MTAAWCAWFPFELESVEGHCLQQVGRVLDGQPLYVAPSLDFVPLIYMPLYFYLAGYWARRSPPHLLAGDSRRSSRIARASSRSSDPRSTDTTCEKWSNLGDSLAERFFGRSEMYTPREPLASSP